MDQSASRKNRFHGRATQAYFASAARSFYRYSVPVTSVLAPKGQRRVHSDIAPDRETSRLAARRKS